MCRSSVMVAFIQFLSHSERIDVYSFCNKGQISLPFVPKSRPRPSSSTCNRGNVYRQSWPPVANRASRLCTPATRSALSCPDWRTSVCSSTSSLSSSWRSCNAPLSGSSVAWAMVLWLVAPCSPAAVSGVAFYAPPPCSRLALRTSLGSRTTIELPKAFWENLKQYRMALGKLIIYCSTVNFLSSLTLVLIFDSLWNNGVHS